MDNFEYNKKVVEERKKLNAHKKKLYAKQRLETNITKKIRTTMIGALASFEDAFGDLWGIDLSYEELSEEQIQFRDVWDEVRTDILNKGNMQIRAAQDELSEYDAEWHRPRIDFIRKD